MNDCVVCVFTIETPPRDSAPLSTSGHPVSERRGLNMFSIREDDCVDVDVGEVDVVVVVDDDDGVVDMVTGTLVGLFSKCTVTFKHGQGK